MPEDVLGLDEVEKIAKEFVRMRWNAEVSRVERIWLSPDHSLYEVEGLAGVHQQDAKTALAKVGDTIADTIKWFTFKLQISTKNGKVLGCGEDYVKPPPGPFYLP